MNLSAAPPPAAPRAAPALDPAACRRDDAATQDACEVFGRVLQSKQRLSRDDSQDTLPDDDDAAAALMAPTGPAPALARAALVPAGASAGAVDTATAGPRASIQAALNSSPALVAPGSSDPATVWEASVRGPDQVAVDVRAERLVTPGAPPTWGLTIGSPALGAEVMARHAPRLNERLRKHGVEVDHVRIESSDDRSRR